MNTKDDIYENFNCMSSDELKDILRTSNGNEIYIEVVEKILLDRNIEIPADKFTIPLKNEQNEKKQLGNKELKKNDIIGNKIIKTNIEPEEEKRQESNNGFWSFDKMVSCSLIKILYILGALGITIFSIIMLINGSQTRYGGSTVILLALVYLVLGNLIWRIVCEGIIIMFKIFEKLNQIDLKIK